MQFQYIPIRGFCNIAKCIRWHRVVQRGIYNQGGENIELPGNVYSKYFSTNSGSLKRQKVQKMAKILAWNIWFANQIQYHSLFSVGQAIDGGQNLHCQWLWLPTPISREHMMTATTTTTILYLLIRFECKHKQQQNNQYQQLQQQQQHSPITEQVLTKL